MAPFEQADMAKRAICPSGYYLASNGFCYRNSAWYGWGRWVFAGIVVLFVVAIMLLLARNSRRRRRQGVAPLRGTGWLAPAPPYYPPPPQYTAQPPVYPQPTGQKFNQNDGYYANQEGIQLQQPQNTYQPQQAFQPQNNADAVYAPPEGPPPKRT
ncbi:chitin synthesis regulation, resistance to congo red-domain-containing protein [Lasiosphaeris hirsuta]|uniref:Chitin synthesis regulation, resistance to congo red-domain-containing protein n=1 Tax=Lasiosphaeris hirsuta TaxID=260670 RepID=A0AA40EDS4_9PEZI|nr:chitin synthesis regulation, resistance to congo red-domain-containing protein [Lasiosphaeris hirsuta]